MQGKNEYFVKWLGYGGWALYIVYSVCLIVDWLSIPEKKKTDCFCGAESANTWEPKVLLFEWFSMLCFSALMVVRAGSTGGRQS